MRRAVGAGLLALAVATVPSCGGDGGGLDRVQEGDWGGEHVALAVTASSATVEFDCSHGRIENPLPLDATGRFAVPGVFVREHGGPVGEGEPEDAHPALYQGTVDGRTLRFTVTLQDEGQTLGPFVAVRGAPPRLFKCLQALPS